MQTRIKELREQKKMTQLTLAVKIGCSQNTISKIEKGEGDPRGSLLIEMAELFGVSIDYMLGFSEQKLTVERKTRLTHLAETSQEYMEKYAKLSEESRKTVDAVVDRMLEIEVNR
ncbi:MAG: helix-turn-helix transcriptional regulator [Clostridiales bacterium]|nr:helix-turn-helix transcriptional regulator [Clostridiales bacterium]